MNGKFFSMIVSSMVRRRKQVFRVALSVFLSFVFITGILLFQENMYHWQMASSKEHFGDWFVMRVQSQKDKESAVAEHPYLENSVTAEISSHLYDAGWNKTDYYIGTMTDAFIKKGNITVDQGSMPEDDDEIALDWNTLLKLNLDPTIGEKVKLRICKGTENDSGNRIEKEYKLVGILNNYTSMWQGGTNVPGAIVSKEAFAEITSDAAANVYLYPLKSFVKTKDYQRIFDKMKEQYKLNLTYNSSVYSYEPWESAVVYHYMYLLTMFIGIAAITYQIIGYQRSRQEHLKRLGQLGATRGQCYGVTLIENVVLLLVSGILGFVAAILLGKGICGVIEARKGVSFYVLSSGVCLKALLSMLIAVAVEELTGLCMSGKRKQRLGLKKNVLKVPRVQLKPKNFIWETHKRLIKQNGLLQNLLIRLFAGAMLVVIVVCAINIYTAYHAYTRNNEQTDFVGFYKEDREGTLYTINYVADMELEKEMTGNGIRPSEFVWMQNSRVATKSVKEWSALADTYYKNNQLYGKIVTQVEGFNFNTYNMDRGGIKRGDSSLSYGISDSMKSQIQNIPGIQDVRYSYYETERNWMWDNMDFKQMGVEKYHSWLDYDYKKTEKYLYATEYVEPTEELYQILSAYMNSDLVDYEAFAKGEQVLVVEDTNSTGAYDDSMKAGISLDYMNYANGFYSTLGGQEVSDSQYITDLKRYVQNHMINEGKTVDLLSGTRYELNTITSDFLTRNVSEETLKENSYYYNHISKYDFSQMAGDHLLEQLKQEYANKKVNLDVYIHKTTPAATTKVAGVVHLSDEVKDALKEYVSEYGQYTAIASTALGQTALDAQNAIVVEEFALDSLPEEITLTMKPNQVSIRYNLTSTFASTNNVVCSYLGQAGFSYVSYSEEKDLLKAKTLETMILYGVTLLAAVVMNLLVGILLTQNRLDRRRERFEILIRTGAQKKTIVGICMLESVRESMWCVAIAPLTLLIHFLIYYGYVRKL